MNIAIVVLGGCFFGSAIAGCLEDVAKDSNWMNCIMSYSNYLQQEMQNTQDVIAIMCSPKGLEVASCMFAYMKQCPALAAQAGSDPATAILMQQGSLKTMCAMMTGPCSVVQQCVQQGSDPMEYPDITPGPTPFSNFPAKLDGLCGPVKSKLDCLAGKKDECPDVVNTIEGIVREVVAANDEEGPDFDTMMRFTSTECPKFPKSLGTNACVKRELESTQFVDCYATVDSVYDTPEKKKSCSAFLAGTKCINDNVGQACGADNAKAIVAAAKIFIAGVPDNCVSQDGGQSGKQDGGQDGGQSGTDGPHGSVGIQTSLWTVIATAAAFVILFRF